MSWVATAVTAAVTAVFICAALPAMTAFRAPASEERDAASDRVAGVMLSRILGLLCLCGSATQHRLGKVLSFEAGLGKPTPQFLLMCPWQGELAHPSPKDLRAV